MHQQLQINIPDLLLRHPYDPRAHDHLVETSLVVHDQLLLVLQLVLEVVDLPEGADPASLVLVVLLRHLVDVDLGQFDHGVDEEVLLDQFVEEVLCEELQVEVEFEGRVLGEDVDRGFKYPGGFC